MIRMDSLEWARDAWEVRSRIYEGIYLPDYPVRITHLAYTDNWEVQEALKTIVRSLLKQHMRRGAIPPHAMVMDWARADRICQGGATDMQRACRVVANTNLREVGNAISSHF